MPRSCDGTGLPSPDGKRIAHFDKDQQLWVLEVATKKQVRLAACGDGDFADIRWSSDGKWLVYSAPDKNLMSRLYLYSTESRR